MSELLTSLSGKTVHMVGIGGISMSGLSEILLSMGIHVTGSDVKNSPIVERLKLKNVPVFLKQEPSNITNQDLVVYTAAMPTDHPELEAARKKGIPVIDRATLLGEIMRSYKKSIAVSGTHGKTTTTSMISYCLMEAEKDPTVHIGGVFDVIGGTTRVGSSEFFVTEACEYKDSFLKLNPYMAVILNIEPDHLDYFHDINQIVNSFSKFAGSVPSDGFVIGNADNEHVLRILGQLKCRTITYGLTSPKAYWTARNITFDENGFPSFRVVCGKKSIMRMKLSIPGLHNVSNSLACIAACNALNIPLDIVQNSLRKFKGTRRRFELKGTIDGIKVVDDYAHHPTEVIATLKSARSCTRGKVLCVFQPHTYTRTKELIDEFSKAFTLADKVYVTDIYAAREKDNGIIHSSELVRRINEHLNNAVYISSFEDIVDSLIHDSSAGDLVLTMGAGDVYKVGEMFLAEKKIRAVG
ncbi:UDP-N-acetylmuramate--L-alanine ligase MurC [Thermoclostridium stercorarium subsp. stercorarium DSM 8532]|jgi:UDP-N-acetylmuramate--alanine ligase|uniref:UDP-N-acetylmuramate--L-alanine ligase n=3 Tax=Thermoclostridium stercorarium TaxID=1510 RepID=L7VSV1_THES1|nr:UDP-N-acetylmuramate--L-alanine ligase [Thermoclostridium stercorarium]AGC69461.1 UDP-N-acetylmuramate--L-alanine ligase MurC [Thermoclostridium stercorarium subsp. stercorarium DSM 8532]AGI40418.1 UDP-N-acetylmuramate-L-alanine ligase [Thermoclostridium stercorarium subsp. stercorarium DSM 8532]ANW99706.1 UDP-N-acetylmuramate--L-alanine ligase [Thermoclostridium stercorarium subsp. thermolacticum DSM 2910]ANX02332.1 UDP-N-acetylmuramate--L-alanine ligase [Thermoclostridium stercorarium subs